MLVNGLIETLLPCKLRQTGTVTEFLSDYPGQRYFCQPSYEGDRVLVVSDRSGKTRVYYATGDNFPLAWSYSITAALQPTLDTCRPLVIDGVLTRIDLESADQNFMVFDVLQDRDYDCRQVQYYWRRIRLERLIVPTLRVRLAPEFMAADFQSVSAYAEWLQPKHKALVIKPERSLYADNQWYKWQP